MFTISKFQCDSSFFLDDCDDSSFYMYIIHAAEESLPIQRAQTKEGMRYMKVTEKFVAKAKGKGSESVCNYVQTN